MLVNNAAILYDIWQNAANADLEVINQALTTNLFGPWRLSQLCIPIMNGAGSLHYMDSGTLACISVDGQKKKSNKLIDT